MKTVQNILATLGNPSCCRIDNPPFMSLSIEQIGKGPHGLPAFSVCHYGEQNGDMMRDPEMCFECDGFGNWYPYYFRNDYMGLEQEVYFTAEDGREMVRPTLKRELATFAKTWSSNLRQQGFIEAAQLHGLQKTV